MEKRLKIYTIHWNEEGFGGGLCVIAANDKEEAKKLAESIKWIYTTGPFEIEGATVGGEPRVLDSNHYQE